MTILFLWLHSLSNYQNHFKTWHDFKCRIWGLIILLLTNIH